MKSFEREFKGNSIIFWFVSHHSYWLTKQHIFIQMNLNDKLLVFDYLILYIFEKV